MAAAPPRLGQSGRPRDQPAAAPANFERRRAAPARRRDHVLRAAPGDHAQLDALPGGRHPRPSGPDGAARELRALRRRKGARGAHHRPRPNRLPRRAAAQRRRARFGRSAVPGAPRQLEGAAQRHHRRGHRHARRQPRRERAGRPRHQQCRSRHECAGEPHGRRGSEPAPRARAVVPALHPHRGHGEGRAQPLPGDRAAGREGAGGDAGAARRPCKARDRPARPRRRATRSRSAT